MSPPRDRTWHRRSSSLIKVYFDTCVFQARRLRFSSCSTEELANIKVRSLLCGKADPRQRLLGNSIFADLLYTQLSYVVL